MTTTKQKYGKSNTLRWWVRAQAVLIGRGSIKGMNWDGSLSMHCIRMSQVVIRCNSRNNKCLNYAIRRGIQESWCVGVNSSNSILWAAEPERRDRWFGECGAPETSSRDLVCSVDGGKRRNYTHTCSWLANWNEPSDWLTDLLVAAEEEAVNGWCVGRA